MIERAAVVGAGVMGAAISAHLANAGIPNLLLDVNRELAASGLTRVKKSKPASFYVAGGASLVTPGNLDDDLDKVADVDWVIEAIVEDFEIKRSLYERLASRLGPKAILSTNTSGLSVARLSEALPVELRSRFLVTHFFNPPRYLRLLEMVPGPETDPDVFEAMALFGDERLGKGVVRAKDTPNFIANRIGAFSMFHALALVAEEGYGVDEIDRMTGRAIGRPKSATFRTADLVGLDTLMHVAANMYDSLPDDPHRDLYRAPDFVQAMLEKGWLGSKTGQGFYKKQKVDGKTQIQALDPATLEYIVSPKANLPSIEMAKNVEALDERLRGLVRANDRAGTFLWKNLAATLVYAANCIPEVSDDIVNVDRALRWGFGWELGPFETWDALGPGWVADRLDKEGLEPPVLVRKLLDSGADSFYRQDGARTLYFDPASGSHRDVPVAPGVIVLQALKRADKVLFDGPDATLVDLGDEVACLEFHTKMNTIGPGIIDALDKSLDLVENGWRGLVIGNEADNFSAGANLLLVLNEIDDDNLEDVEWMVRRFQDVNQRIRFSSVPVVVAPRGLTLGGGCEVTLAADRVCAAAETYIGLVELGAGVVPAGGGCKELVKRLHLSLPEGIKPDLFPLVRRVFETVGMAKIATSGHEGRELGFLRADDPVVLNVDRLIQSAKDQVFALSLQGYRPGRPLEDIRVMGEPGLAAIRAGLHNLRASGFITEYDVVVGDKLAWILCGGEIDGPARVSEQYLLDLEREAFLTLCQNPRTQDRMEHILKTGKPLRN